MVPRRIDRLRLACPLTAQPVGSWQVPVRAPLPCSPDESVPAPAFHEATQIEAVQPTLRIPDALAITNEFFQLHCADIEGGGPHGTPATVEAGELTRYLYWIDVPDITDIQLNYLAGLTPEQLQPLLVLDVTTDTIQTITKLYSTQLGFVQGLLVGVLTNVQDAVYTTAVSRIRCVWKNTMQTVTCPDPAAARTSQSVAAAAAGVLNPVTILAGTFESQDSQSAADGLAHIEAVRKLTCLYGNDAFELRCTDVGYQEEVPTDPEDAPSAPDGRRRVGSVFVAADTVFAATKAEAESLARGQARQQLDCFYVNQLLSVSCADQDPDLADVFVKPVDYDAQTTGNPITVPAGSFVVSNTSDTQATADALARSTAAYLLDCQYRNVRQVVRCESITIGAVVLPPADAIKEIIVEAGEVAASSQAEADALAIELGRLQLNCQYCNAYIPPSCYPPNYTPPTGQAIPLSDVTSDWSVDVVLGLTAGTLCMDDPEQVPAVAQAIAIQRVEPPEAGCVYVNDEMWFGCLDALPGGGTLPKGGYHAPAYPGNTPVVGYETLPLAEQLSPYCVPDVALGAKSYIVLQAGQYPINSKDVPPGMEPKQYANEQARLYGMSLLRCAFANPALTLTCETAYEPPFVQEQVAKNSGETVSVQVPKASHESAFSFRDTIRDAKLEAQAQLVCHYENPEMIVRCWPQYGQAGQRPALVAGLSSEALLVYGDGTATRSWVAGSTPYSEIVTLQDWQPGSTTTPVVVPRGTFTSLLSRDAAIAQALNYAIASLDCTGQARDTNVCNDPLLIFCGGAVDPNPASPYQAGTNATIAANQSVAPGGRIRMGNGHNYVMSRNTTTGVWDRLDLGCANDPVGGCEGTGLEVPPCIATAQTREEANAIAYQIMRTQLTCAGSAAVPDLSSLGGGSGGGGGGDGAPERCPLSVYQKEDADGNPIEGKFGITAGFVNRAAVRYGSSGGPVISNASPPTISLTDGVIYLRSDWALTFAEGYLATASPTSHFVSKKSGAVSSDDANTGIFYLTLATIEDGLIVDNYTSCSNLTEFVYDAQTEDDGAVIVIVKGY